MSLSHSRSLFRKYFMDHKWKSCSLAALLIAQIPSARIPVLHCAAVAAPTLPLSCITNVQSCCCCSPRHSLTLCFVSQLESTQIKVRRGLPGEDRRHDPAAMHMAMLSSLLKWDKHIQTVSGEGSQCHAAWAVHGHVHQWGLARCVSWVCFVY